MKNLKNNRWLAGMAMIVLLLSVLFVANAIENKAEKNNTATEKVILAPQWYEFTNNLNDGDASNPLNYSLTPNAGQSPPSCPTGEDQVCAVHTLPDQDDPDIPDLSSNSIIETRMKAE